MQAMVKGVSQCLRLSRVPREKWYCQYCQNLQQREKGMKFNKNALAAGRVPRADPVEQILQRCIRIVKIPEVDIGCCVISRPEAEWFCRENCSMIYVTLQELICKEAELPPEADAYMIIRKLEEKGLNNESNADIRWSLLSRKILDADKKLLLTEAISIFHFSHYFMDSNTYSWTQEYAKGII